MKRIKLIFCALLLAVGISLSQNITVLEKNQVYKSPQDNMVVLSIKTFAKYQYSLKQLDSLKKIAKRYDTLCSVQNEINTKQIEQYQKLIIEKQKEVNAYKQSYEQLNQATQDCIDKQNQLQTSYSKIQNKHRRAKRWRNFFIGTTAVLSTIIVLSIVK